MDTTSKFIKMCKAEEIQSGWHPADGDFYVYSVRVHYPHVYKEESKLSAELMNKDNWIWLPRQDQLQDMLSDTVAVGYMINGLEAFYDPERYCTHDDDPCRRCRNLGGRRRLSYDSLEQWNLAFVMYERFGLEWDGSNWNKVEG